MKTCKICKHTKEESMFRFNQNRFEKTCKECTNKQSTKWKRSKQGVIYTIYNSQIQSSRNKGFRSVEYSRDELKEWILSQTKFHELYSEWVQGGYKKRLKPSIDRKNDYIHYCFSNIQLMTWGDNDNKGNNDIKNGQNNKISKQVIQLSKDGKFINTYHSTAEAQRATRVQQSHISDVCNGQRNHAGGFKWIYN